MSNYGEKFIEANDQFKKIGKHTQDRKAIFLRLVGDTEKAREFYKKEVYRFNYRAYIARNNGKCYKGFTPSMRRFQKSEKYRSYRRKYEAAYRGEYRMRVNYNSWKSITKPTPMQEIDYLLKRFLR